MPDDTILKWLLRGIGGAELLAAPFVVLPLAGIDWVHANLLGLGPLPAGPAVEYMARGMSALYATHGAMILALSLDVVRYRPLVKLFGVLQLVLGAGGLYACLVAGMPAHYWLAEGPGVIALGVVILVLARAGENLTPQPPSLGGKGESASPPPPRGGVGEGFS